MERCFETWHVAEFGCLLASIRTTAAPYGEEQKLTASNGAGSGYFGQSVSISVDYAIVGAHRDDDNGIESGSAFFLSATLAHGTKF